MGKILSYCRSKARDDYTMEQRDYEDDRPLKTLESLDLFIDPTSQDSFYFLGETEKTGGYLLMSLEKK